MAQKNQSICLISLALVYLNLPTKTVGVCGIRLFMTLVLISNSPFVHTKKQGNLYNNKATYHMSLVIVFFFQTPLHLIAFVPRSNTATLPQYIFKTLNDIILLNSLSVEIKSALQVILPETPCWGPALS